MKKLFWIDDDPTLMKQVANGVFPELWDNEIASEILFLGDSFKSDSKIMDLTHKDIKDFSDSILSLFYEYCYEEDDINEEGSKYKALQELKPDINSARLVIEENDLKDYIEKWKNITAKDFADGKLSEDFSSERLMKALKIPDNSCVALDLALLFDDLDRIENKQYPILSMELYFRLKEAKCMCFLFSQYTYHDGFKIKWIETYKRIYGDEVIDIHTRNNLREKRVNNSTIQKLIEMVTESDNKLF